MNKKILVPKWFDSYAQKLIGSSYLFNDSNDRISKTNSQDLIKALAEIITKMDEHDIRIVSHESGLDQWMIRDLQEYPSLFFSAAINGWWEVEKDTYEIILSDGYPLTEVGKVNVNTLGDISVNVVSDKKDLPLRFCNKEQAEALATLAKGEVVLVDLRNSFY